MSGKPWRFLQDFGMILVRSAHDPGGAVMRMEDLCVGGRESRKRGGKTSGEGEERRIVKIRSN